MTITTAKKRPGAAATASEPVSSNPRKGKAMNVHTDTTVSSRSARETSYGIDDIIGDAVNLYELIEATRDVLLEMDYGSGAGRNHELDRVAALTHIASMLALRISDTVTANYSALGGWNREAGQ